MIDEGTGFWNVMLCLLVIFIEDEEELGALVFMVVEEE
jgi:hypothetical protein